MHPLKLIYQVRPVCLEAQGSSKNAVASTYWEEAIPQRMLTRGHKKSTLDERFTTVEVDVSTKTIPSVFTLAPVMLADQ